MMLDLDAIRKRWKETCLDVAAMLAELERLYAAPVAEPAQATTPGAQEAAIAGELQRMATKPRSNQPTVMRLDSACQRCGSFDVHVQTWEKGETIYVCGNCWWEECENGYAGQPTMKEKSE